MKRKFNKITILISILISMFLCSCGSDTVNNINYINKIDVGDSGVTGLIYRDSYAVQDSGITASGFRYWYSGWDEMDYRIICTDITCKHETSDGSTCSANRMGTGGISFISGDKRIMLFTDDFDETTDEDKDGITKKIKYVTAIYTTDMDGSNRKRVGEFSGDILSPTRWSVICNNYLFFASVIEENSVVENTVVDGMPGESYISRTFDIAIYAFNVDSFEVIKVTEIPDLVQLPSFDFYASGDIVCFAGEMTIENNGEKQTIFPLYSIDCSQSMKCIRMSENTDESKYCSLFGTDGEMIYYGRDDGTENIYRMNTDTGEEEIFAVSDNQGYATALVIKEDTIAVRKSNIKWNEQEGFRVDEHLDEYVCIWDFYDTNGVIKDSVEYPGHIVEYQNVLGDYIIYCDIYSDINGLGYIQFSDIENLIDKGEKLFGWSATDLDNILNSELKEE